MTLLAVASAVLSTTSILLGLYVFDDVPNDICLETTYEDDRVCMPCRDWINPFCNKCDGWATCSECDSGYYPDLRRCIDCAESFGTNCAECDSTSCLNCVAPYVVQYGQCTACDIIENCVAGACDTTSGCTECEDGYYVNDVGTCSSCSKALNGCTNCRSATVCTECASSFLTINSGKCECIEGRTNMYKGDSGACLCDEGYYLTEGGCLAGNYLLPYCTSFSTV